MTRPKFPYEPTSAEDFERIRESDSLRYSPYAKYTYFMRDRRNGLIKIGMSLDPDSRRARLSSSGFRDMEILATVRGGDLEGCYHRHFEDICVGGEWFEPHQDLMDEIERVSK